MTTPSKVLDDAYNKASTAAPPISTLSTQQQAWVKEIAEKAENQKAVLAVLLTSLVKKVVSPQQDVRLHQDNMKDGYSGRGFDATNVTPFLKRKLRRLSMSESGWLTRSLEQNHAYNLNYPGKVRDKAVKIALLQILNDIEANQADPTAYLEELFVLLKRHGSAAQILSAQIPDAGQLTIARAVQALQTHFFSSYHGSGASRLPVLAIHSIYAVSMRDEEYLHKRLLPLKSHTTSDLRSSTLGDVEVANESGKFFEVIEVKHNIAITPVLVEDAVAKFRQVPLDRYYLLTTANPNSIDASIIETTIERVRSEHGCEIIVNGVLPTIKYYLRRGKRTAAFLETYTQSLQDDFTANADLKEVHLQRWNEILAELSNKNE